MENDPSKKESKGKRILKKAIRRNSKSSNNNSQSSAMEQGIGVSRSKSFENKRLSIEINDSTPLPKPDGAKETVEHDTPQKLKIDERLFPSQDGPSDEVKLKKVVEIQESRNEIFSESATASKNSAKPRSSPRLEKKDDRISEIDAHKKSLKRVRFITSLVFVSRIECFGLCVDGLHVITIASRAPAMCCILCTDTLCRYSF